MACRGRLTGRRTSNSVYDGVGISADATGYFGFYRHGWFAAALAPPVVGGLSLGWGL